MEDSEDMIGCTIAVAPVTNWALYGKLESLFCHGFFSWHIIMVFVISDSAYTERYMGLPNADGNWKGYESADLASHVDSFKERSSRYFLVHGSSDENVHLQHSMVWSKVLVNNNIQFRQQVCDIEK